MAVKRRSGRSEIRYKTSEEKLIAMPAGEFPANDAYTDAEDRGVWADVIPSVARDLGGGWRGTRRRN